MSGKITKTILSVSILFILFTCIVTPIQGQIWDPFHTKTEKIDLWMDLWNSNPDADYESVGKTYEGRDIWLFKIGNPNGKKVLWDGEMHGNEDKGSEVMYLIAEWLVKSDDETARKILENNFIMFIPILNVDSYGRGNNNFEDSPYGVNLNRNFETGWTYGGINPSTPPHSDYSGFYAASEPETKTLLNVFNRFRPDFYVNLHCGSRRPFLAYYNQGNITLAQQVIKQIEQISLAMNTTMYAIHSFGSEGFAIGDASNFGISAWLLEVEGEDTAWRHTDELYQKLIDETFPKCLAIFKAMCQIQQEISIKSCNVSGFEKSTFNTGETVYVTGQGFSALKAYEIHLIMDTVVWIEGMNIPERISSTTPTLTIVANTEGTILPTSLWTFVEEENYDIIIDINGNGRFDREIDVLDEIKIIQGEIIPEYQEIQIFSLFVVTTFFAIIAKKYLHSNIIKTT